MSSKVVRAALAAAATLFVSCGSKPVAETPAPEKPKEATRRISLTAEHPHWSYEDMSGPANWKTLSPKWSACGGAGHQQSPIDIDKTSKVSLPAMKAEFSPAEIKIIHHEHIADVVNTGHSVQVNYTGGDKLELGSEIFDLLQYHFHSPSEHTVHGKQYPMEMHLVHKSAEGKLAVVGVLIQEGQKNAAFEPVWANLPASKGPERHLPHVSVDINDLLPKSNASYRYTGSLTTPPCSEGVKWIVMSNPVELSVEQIGKFREIVKGNNRPTQPLSGRAVVTDHVVESAAR